MGTNAVRTAPGIIAGLAFALLVVGMSPHRVGAETFTHGAISVTQHEYVGICKGAGGASSRVSSGVVKCDMGGGYSSTCNFKTNTCSDTIPDRVAPTRGTSITGAGASQTLGGQAQNANSTP